MLKHEMIFTKCVVLFKEIGITKNGAAEIGILKFAYAIHAELVKLLVGKQNHPYVIQKLKL
jgi:hypothetical protein